MKKLTLADRIKAAANTPLAEQSQRESYTKPLNREKLVKNYIKLCQRDEELSNLLLSSIDDARALNRQEIDHYACITSKPPDKADQCSKKQATDRNWSLRKNTIHGADQCPQSNKQDHHASLIYKNHRGDPDPSSESHPQGNRDPSRETRLESNPYPNSDTRPGGHPDLSRETRPESHPDPSSESRLRSHPDPRRESRPILKSHTIPSKHKQSPPPTNAAQTLEANSRNFQDPQPSTSSQIRQYLNKSSRTTSPRPSYSSGIPDSSIINTQTPDRNTSSGDALSLSSQTDQSLNNFICDSQSSSFLQIYKDPNRSENSQTFPDSKVCDSPINSGDIIPYCQSKDDPIQEYTNCRGMDNSNPSLQLSSEKESNIFVNREKDISTGDHYRQGDNGATTSDQMGNKTLSDKCDQSEFSDDVIVCKNQQNSPQEIPPSALSSESGNVSRQETRVYTLGSREVEDSNSSSSFVHDQSSVSLDRISHSSEAFTESKSASLYSSTPDGTPGLHFSTPANEPLKEIGSGKCSSLGGETLLAAETSLVSVGLGTAGLAESSNYSTCPISHSTDPDTPQVVPEGRISISGFSDQQKTIRSSPEYSGALDGDPKKESIGSATEDTGALDGDRKKESTFIDMGLTTSYHEVHQTKTSFLDSSNPQIVDGCRAGDNVRRSSDPKSASVTMMNHNDLISTGVSDASSNSRRPPESEDPDNTQLERSDLDSSTQVVTLLPSKPFSSSTSRNQNPLLTIELPTNQLTNSTSSTSAQRKFLSKDDTISGAYDEQVVTPLTLSTREDVQHSTPTPNRTKLQASPSEPTLPKNEALSNLPIQKTSTKADQNQNITSPTTHINAVHGGIVLPDTKDREFRDKRPIDSKRGERDMTDLAYRERDLTEYSRGARDTPNNPQKQEDSLKLPSVKQKCRTTSRAPTGVFIGRSGFLPIQSTTNLSSRESSGLASRNQHLETGKKQSDRTDVQVKESSTDLKSYRQKIKQSVYGQTRNRALSKHLQKFGEQSNTNRTEKKKTSTKTETMTPLPERKRLFKPSTCTILNESFLTELPGLAPKQAPFGEFPKTLEWFLKPGEVEFDERFVFEEKKQTKSKAYRLIQRQRIARNIPSYDCLFNKSRKKKLKMTRIQKVRFRDDVVF